MASGRDRISQLPVDILDHILGLLPIKDAAKTAVLSSIWRGVWSGLTRLNFDDRFFDHIDRKYHLKYRRAKKYGMKSAPSLHVINKVLMMHNGTIRKFVLKFSYLGVVAMRYRSFDIDQWLLLVTRKGVEEIYLGFDERGYKLPSCLFTCLTLKRLHLNGFIFEPMKLPSILPNVASLCFEHVDFGHTNILDRAYDVPVLENLSFLNCQNMFRFNITAPKLRSLTIKSCSFKVLGKFLPRNLDFRSIHTLELEGSLQEFVKEFTRLGFRLNVKSLKLSCFSHQSDVTTSAFVHLLELCPKLCKLEIDLSMDKLFISSFPWLESIASKSVDALFKLLEKLPSAAQTNKMLQSLKVISFEGSLYEILFVGKLLASFPTLKKVVIVREYKYGSKEKCRITKELLRFHGASTNAEIIFI